MDIRKENELDRQMDLLQMKEISTYRQQKNGTRIFELPIIKYGQKIQVGSFESGYVRRMNGCYTPYQLNKCENYDHFYQAYEWKTLNNGDYTQVKLPGKYNKHVCRKRILIPNEVDRLEYLIAFCLKNYYINQANMIENGEFIPKWKHEYEMKNGSIDKVRELQDENSNLYKEIEDLQKYQTKLLKRNDRISEEKDNMDRRFEETAMELDELHVTVNGHRYKVI